LFGGVDYYPYLCITELVINPTGGGPGGGRVDSTALYILYKSPVHYEYHNHHKGLFFLFNIIIK
jgi:hypothetical protein